MLMNHTEQVVKIGAGGIVILMLAALVTHLRVRNPFSKLPPSLTLMCASLVILLVS